jgi:hypothetical protein
MGKKGWIPPDPPEAGGALPALGGDRQVRNPTDYD